MLNTELSKYICQIQDVSFDMHKHSRKIIRLLTLSLCWFVLFLVFGTLRNIKTHVIVEQYRNKSEMLRTATPMLLCNDYGNHLQTALCDNPEDCSSPQFHHFESLACYIFFVSNVVTL
jgi:hypothetical protein